MPVRQRKNRQDILRRHFPLRKTSMLEIGALDFPTFRPEKVDISFMDWLSTEQLRERYPHRRVDEIPTVTHVVTCKRVAESIDRRYDLIIANHVLEHIADPLSWLGELESLLKPGGSIFLSLPDKRYTFDIIREKTDFAELLRCYHADLDRPDLYHLFRAYYYWRPVCADDVWSGDDIDARKKRARYTVQQALARAEEALREYTDVHCHVFTSASFTQLWADIESSGLTGLSLRYVDDVIENDNEFHVILGARQEGAAGG